MKPILAVTFVVMFVGKDTGIPAFARGDADNMTEERIAHILSEASHMMKTQVEDSHSNDSKSPNQGQVRYVNLQLPHYINFNLLHCLGGCVLMLIHAVWARMS